MVQDLILLRTNFGVVSLNVVFDVCVFNSHTTSNGHPYCYRKHKMKKKRQYELWVGEVEHVSFTPFVGGMADEATVFY